MIKRVSFPVFFTSGMLLIFLFQACENERKSAPKEFNSAGENMFYDGKGIGPIEVVTLNQELDPKWIKQGEELFHAKCITCHEITDVRKIGPGLSGITKIRRPEWIMNQILNPMEMTQKDSLSKELLSIYMAQMTDMELTKEEARSVLEYFRSIDQ